jgi:hypothetical protein
MDPVAKPLAEIAAREAHLFGCPLPDAIENGLRPLGAELLPQRLGGDVAGK